MQLLSTRLQLRSPDDDTDNAGGGEKQEPGTEVVGERSELARLNVRRLRGFGA